MLSIGSLFSGIGGLELGLEWAGLGPVLWQCEIDEYCRNILARHWPETPRYADVRLLRGRDLPRPDLICGGFPCQDVSSAGAREGLAGRRSGLWRQFARIVEELEPSWVVVENVTSGARLWVDAVRTDLGRLGYESLPIPLSASDVGAPHRRSRVFIVAHLDAQSQPAEPVDAEVGRAPQAPADAHGFAERESNAAASAKLHGWPRPRTTPSANADSAALRLEPRRARGQNGSSPVLARTAAADADCARQRAGLGLGSSGSSAIRAHGWRPQPGLVPVVHGISGRLDCRIRSAFGNSVVPQCAEVVGWIIRELAGLEG